jgi:diguanylate cyclase (GGDEF)-like protein/PAS domain S-box-containing protein
VKVPLMNADGVPHALLGISTDITEQKRLEKELRRSEKKLTTILDNIKAHVYIKDINFVYTYVNADMCDYLDREKDDVIGKTDEDIFGKEYSDHFRRIDRQVFDFVENITCIEESQDRRTGETRHFWTVKVPLINDLGNPYAILGISSDVSEQKRLEDELRRMASTDVLTGINNRRYFLEMCEREIHRAQRYDHDLSLIMLDIDHFKQINDTYGHSIGDEAIRDMTRICQDNMRTTDIIGRLGGEEFALLLPETDTIGAWQIAQRIRTHAESHTFNTGGTEVGRFTVSLGITGIDKDDETPDDLLKRADIALYDAKKSGRNRVCES